MKSVNIQPFLTYVRAEYVNGDSGFFDAIVFAISSISGKFPKFKALVNNEILISNLPINAISSSKNEEIDEENLCFIHSPNEDIIVNVYDYLLDIKTCHILNDDLDVVASGDYVLSISWSGTDKEMHLIEMTNGYYILCPETLLRWN
jgi:hypothetical protein